MRLAPFLALHKITNYEVLIFMYFAVAVQIRDNHELLCFFFFLGERERGGGGSLN